MANKAIEAEPYELEFDPKSTALLIIDMQRDFVMPGGFGEALGNDVTPLQATIAPTKRVLEAARKKGMLVIHTREGHRPDLTDCPPTTLVRGEIGHDIVPELYPAPGEPVIDKPGKGAFYATDLELILRDRGSKTLIVCGVTTEVCVNTSVREANDRGYECVVLSDCVGSYFPEFQKAALAMIKAQGGIFGWVSDSRRALAALGA